MTRTLHGKVHGRTIELDEDLGVAEGQEVEVQVKMLGPIKPPSSEMSQGLVKVYSILGERYQSGHSDTAARHDKHQP